MSEWVMAAKSPTSTEFSVLVLIAFLLKIDIPGLAINYMMLGSSKISSSTVVVICTYA